MHLVIALDSLFFFRHYKSRLQLFFALLVLNDFVRDFSSIELVQVVHDLDLQLSDDFLLELRLLVGWEEMHFELEGRLLLWNNATEEFGVVAVEFSVVRIVVDLFAVEVVLTSVLSVATATVATIASEVSVSIVAIVVVVVAAIFATEALITVAALASISVVVVALPVAIATTFFSSLVIASVLIPVLVVLLLIRVVITVEGWTGDREFFFLIGHCFAFFSSVISCRRCALSICILLF